MPLRNWRWTTENALGCPGYSPQLLAALEKPAYLLVTLCWGRLEFTLKCASLQNPKYQEWYVSEPYSLALHARLMRLLDQGYAYHEEGETLFFWPAGQAYSIIQQDRQIAVVRDGLTLPEACRQLSRISLDYGFEHGGRGGGWSFGGPDYTLVGKPGEERKVHHFIWPEGMPVIPVADRQPVQLDLL